MYDRNTHTVMPVDEESFEEIGDTSRNLSGSILRSNGLAGLLKTGRVQNYAP